MQVRYKLSTLLYVSEVTAKVAEIMREIAQTFGEQVVSMLSPNSIAVSFNGHLTLTKVARLDALVGRLADLAKSASLVQTETDGYQNRVRVVGPSARDISRMANLNYNRFAALDNQRQRLAHLGVIQGREEMGLQCSQR